MSIELGKAVYEAAAKDASSGPGDPTDSGTESSSNDDVIDAEFEVKDE